MDKSGIDLIDNLHVDKFKPTDSGTFSTSYTKDSLTKVFKITYECSEDFVLTYTNLDT